MTANVAAQEAFYLARVGAFRYLNELRHALGVRAEGVEVPKDFGLVPKKPPVHLQTALRRYQRTLGAFDVYERAERLALDTLPSLNPDQEADVARAMVRGIGEGLAVRAQLLAKGHPLPGRGAWLVPEEQADQQAA